MSVLNITKSILLQFSWPPITTGAYLPCRNIKGDVFFFFFAKLLHNRLNIGPFVFCLARKNYPSIRLSCRALQEDWISKCFWKHDHCHLAREWGEINFAPLTENYIGKRCETFSGGWTHGDILSWELQNSHHYLQCLIQPYLLPTVDITANNEAESKWNYARVLFKMHPTI